MYNRSDTIAACDGRTDILPRHSPRYAYASRGKNMNAIPTAIILYLFVRQSRLAGRIMFSTCPSVCPFVRLLPTFERYTSKTNCWHNSVPGEAHERSTSGVSRSKINVTGGQTYVW